jgi:hypothetical protein
MSLMLSTGGENDPDVHKREGFVGFRAVTDEINNKKISSRVRFPMLLGFSIDLILPAALWPRGRLSL